MWQNSNIWEQHCQIKYTPHRKILQIKLVSLKLSIICIWHNRLHNEPVCDEHDRTPSLVSFLPGWLVAWLAGWHCHFSPEDGEICLSVTLISTYETTRHQNSNHHHLHHTQHRKTLNPSWIHLAQDMDQWLGPVNTIMKVQGILWLAGDY
jgi:hypothetical protein